MNSEKPAKSIITLITDLGVLGANVSQIMIFKTTYPFNFSFNIKKILRVQIMFSNATDTLAIPIGNAFGIFLSIYPTGDPH